MLLIVQGVFRSGTTALFEVLRQDKRFRCYYEPLHPNLILHLKDRMAAEPRHPKAANFSEYLDYYGEIAELFNPLYASEQSILRENDDAPQLEAYLRFLAQSHSDVVLQVNRAFWCSAWLYRVFPEAHFVHIIRDPRAVVWSQLTRPSRQHVALVLPFRKQWVVTSDLRKVFSRFTYFGAYHVRDYLDMGERRLAALGEPGLLSEEGNRLVSMRKCRPYVRALALWGAQARICHEQASSAFGERYQLVRYEDFCSSPVDIVGCIYGNINRDVPDQVEQYAQREIHTRRLAPWHNIPGATRRFNKGLRQAGIWDFARTLGYEECRG